MRPGKIDWGQVLIALISCHNVFSCSRIDYDYIKILENVVSTFMIQHQSHPNACAWLAARYKSRNLNLTAKTIELYKDVE